MFPDLALLRLSLLAWTLAVAKAGATVCEGPDLHDVQVGLDGSLHISGSAGHAAWSRDGGRHWADLPVDPARNSDRRHFWPVALRSPEGVRYQNLLVNDETDIVIRSRDGGSTWEQVPLAPRALLLQDDTHGAWWMAHNDLRVMRSEGSVGAFWLRGVSHDSGRLEEDTPSTTIEFDGSRLVTHSSMHATAGDRLPPPFDWQGDGHVTGFAVDAHGTIWLSGRDGLVRGPDNGLRWERVRVPPAAAWVHCNGDAPRMPPPRE